ncbi:Uncharacterised protein [Salmonella enterica subsp. enterica]|uniref:Uncharacterized protein n=1 Tax=Salmonella enterica I TaxID=59201 RepID=A0A379VSH8_SALET|nr:Uncharacterised protein [Salmonella enterica subsp. enterica]
MIEVFEAFGWTFTFRQSGSGSTVLSLHWIETVIIAFDTPVELVLQIIVPEIYHF